MEEFPQNIGRSKDIINETEQSSIKEGIDFVFEQNPELLVIGNKEQYLQYLKTIFPESKIKNIVYHGGNKNIESFNKERLGEYTKANSARLGFFFSTNKNVSLDYISTQYYSWEGKYLDYLNEEKEVLKNLNEEVDKKEQELKKLYIEQKNKLGATLEVIKNFLKISKKGSLNEEQLVILEKDIANKLKEIRQKETEFNIKRLTVTDFSDKTQTNIFDNIKILLKQHEDKQLYSAILNIKDPYHDTSISNNDGTYTDGIEKAIKENKDGVILKNVVDINKYPLAIHHYGASYVKEGSLLEDHYKGDDVVVFEPDQIHILGSKSDLGKFKEFIETQKANFNQ